MSKEHPQCPDCRPGLPAHVDRRQFLKTASAATTAACTVGLWPAVSFARSASVEPEAGAKELHGLLTADQRKKVCFPWDFVDPKRGLLRTRVAANWKITEPVVNSDFFTADQKHLIRGIFDGIVQPDWHARFDKQLKDDVGGFGNHQSIALFGDPDRGPFQFVLTGRHMTIRCDGDSAEHVAFGGPIFYGHAAGAFNEKPTHPGNVFWQQAVAANKVYDMLDTKQRKQATVAKSPRENQVAFQGSKSVGQGIRVADLSSDQQELVERVLQKLVEPYRQRDRDEVRQCLKAQGGLDACILSFYTDKDIGQDGVWDNWRLEGPSFVWYFRGSPHVHVWVHVANDPSVKLNS